jgi:hypothetical protein
MDKEPTPKNMAEIQITKAQFTGASVVKEEDPDGDITGFTIHVSHKSLIAKRAGGLHSVHTFPYPVLNGCSFVAIGACLRSCFDSAFVMYIISRHTRFHNSVHAFTVFCALFRFLSRRSTTARTLRGTCGLKTKDSGSSGCCVSPTRWPSSNG